MVLGSAFSQSLHPILRKPCWLCQNLVTSYHPTLTYCPTLDGAPTSSALIPPVAVTGLLASTPFFQVSSPHSSQSDPLKLKSDHVNLLPQARQSSSSHSGWRSEASKALEGRLPGHHPHLLPFLLMLLCSGSSVLPLPPGNMVGRPGRGVGWALPWTLPLSGTVFPIYQQVLLLTACKFFSNVNFSQDLL